MDTLCIDPGSKLVAWALWGERFLKDCGLVRGATFDALLMQCHKMPQDFGHLVIEKPVVYPRSKGDPNDLISISLVAGAVAGWFGRGATAEFVTPRTWKGNVPKDIHNLRVQRKLTMEERELLHRIKPASLRHNVIDAIGIGMWKIERSL